MHAQPKTILAALAIASLSLALPVSSSACAARHKAAAEDADAIALAENGSDTSAAESDTETMTTSFLSAASARLGVASNGSSYYQPADCLTSTRDDAAQKATLTFNQCSGPLGLLHVTGTIDLAWSTSAGALHLDVSGSALRVNKATVDVWTASADITADGAKRTMRWSAHLEGTTARARPFARDNAKTIEWTVGEACIVVNGTSSGHVASRSFHTTIKSYGRCRGQCPEAGSEITITSDTDGRSIDITFDGANHATFTTGATSTEITLACGL
jgi:hypothetical protein